MKNITMMFAILALTGCASTSEWRVLRIDGSDQPAFGASLTTINDSLSPMRQQMFALALVDIANTEARAAEALTPGAGATYSDADLRRVLDGLTYQDVIDLADESGPKIAEVYYRTRGPRVGARRDDGFSAPRPAGPIGPFGPASQPGSTGGGLYSPGDSLRPGP